MPRTMKKLSMSMATAVALLLIFVTPKIGGAVNTNYYGSTYFNVYSYDNFVHYVNATDQTLCAEIYVFDNAEQMQECCACPLTSNQSLQSSVEYDLTANPAIPPITSTGLILVVATSPLASGACPDPSSSFSATPTIAEWIEHNGLSSYVLPAQTSYVSGSAEVNFRYSSLNTTTQQNLAGECAIDESFAPAGSCAVNLEGYNTCPNVKETATLAGKEKK